MAKGMFLPIELHGEKAVPGRKKILQAVKSWKNDD